MKLRRDNFAYIDAANLHSALKGYDWRFDYGRFRVWLTEKYGVTRAYLFIGWIPKYEDRYTELQELGYVLVFKQVIYDNKGKPKGNCDADLVLRAVRDVFEIPFEKAILVSSDGDYDGLVKFLLEKRKMEVILSPAKKEKCSILLKRTNARIAYINDQAHILSAHKEKAPDGDETP
jgi:uncharacterized LabA/DUF88 family protein